MAKAVCHSEARVGPTKYQTRILPAGSLKGENIMDTGRGEFAQVSPSMADLLKQKTLKGSVFETGETVKLKDCQFKVTNIGRHTLTLRLLPDDNYQQVPR